MLVLYLFSFTASAAGAVTVLAAAIASICWVRRRSRLRQQDDLAGKVSVGDLRELGLDRIASKTDHGGGGGYRDDDLGDPVLDVEALRMFDRLVSKVHEEFHQQGQLSDGWGGIERHHIDSHTDSHTDSHSDVLEVTSMCMPKPLLGLYPGNRAGDEAVIQQSLIISEQANNQRCMAVCQSLCLVWHTFPHSCVAWMHFGCHCTSLCSFIEGCNFIRAPLGVRKGWEVVMTLTTMQMGPGAERNIQLGESRLLPALIAAEVIRQQLLYSC